MRFAEEVKGLILHPDFLIRCFAIDYFGRLESQNTELLPIALKAVAMTADQKLQQRLLAASTRLMPGKDDLDEIVPIMFHSPFRLSYEVMLTDAPVSLLAEYTELMPQLSSKRRKAAMNRIRLADMDSDQMFRQLVAHSASGKGKYVEEFDFAYGVYLAREIAWRGDAPIGDIRQWLDRGFGEYDTGYDEVYGCVLAGYLHLEDAIPRLIAILHGDADVLLEEAARALTRIGTPEVVARLREEFPSGGKYFRQWAANVLPTIQDAEAERVLLEMLPTEEDITVRTVLADGLCQVLSVEGIPMVQNVMANGYDRWLLNLNEPMYANCIINGIDLPDLPQWKEELEKKVQHEMEGLDAMSSLAKRMEVSGIGLPHAKTVKVGRNEKCPCGSGKKYKKCCGA